MNKLSLIYSKSYFIYDRWVPISDFTEPSILVKEGLLDVQGKVIYKETEKKEKSSKEMTQIVESRKRASDVQEVTRN